MQGSQLIFKGGVITLGILGGLLLVTNPGQKNYEDYAATSLSTYLKQDFCQKANGQGGDFLVTQCKSLVDIARPQLDEFIATKTERSNFFLFSIYETNISLFDPLPSYRFQTVGFLQQFYTYNHEKL
ncbi:MAG: DUF4359 domain-containing protein [Gloeocapsa sp. DLM2.Bin57]|jgi:hypothetical protein|nr:MAG: DUF4359 domain-containing protein [Gloeocapsa sp. DLM2.Bin57]